MRYLIFRKKFYIKKKFCFRPPAIPPGEGGTPNETYTSSALTVFHPKRYRGGQAKLTHFF